MDCLTNVKNYTDIKLTPPPPPPGKTALKKRNLIRVKEASKNLLVHNIFTKISQQKTSFLESTVKNANFPS